VTSHDDNAVPGFPIYAFQVWTLQFDGDEMVEVVDTILVKKNQQKS
jgi:hypothetical protein